ncbi:ABC transporter substrate-binding protein [Methylocapsa acidiphila]|uniref:Abc transporter substrate-binding protein, similar to blr6192 of Bradyrhizobium japonicum n=1 Tax=Methylocapsa acidiphila TaxID=133552 RepID=Q2VNI4_METAI|nr:ABC transporter substrate-binding protein [Methylocapsa acidiphila]CAJ01648.1 abc transporter substrate-binding protein, similar to blr6192 of Bradyrhizobium japonicum [Methylocapsa acidiphila]
MVFYLAVAVVFICAPLALGSASAAETLRIGVQKTGTLGWELAIIKARGLDKKADLDLKVAELASPEAGKIALIGGSVDMILSDLLWVARERSLGAHLLFKPYSSALGALMVPAGSPIRDLADLKNRKLAVAGGPLDKSWLLLRALARRANIDLKGEAEIIYGAPALLYEKAASGEADASLNFWNFCVALEARGFKRLIGMDEVERRLGAKEPVALVGYVFDESLAQKSPAALARFFAIAAEVRDSLVHSEVEWATLAPRIGVSDPVQLALYRRTYADGVPRRSIDAEAADARALYRILAEIGGADLVGPAQDLDAAIYYRPPQDN